VTSLKDIVNPPPAQETVRQSTPPEANKGNASTHTPSVAPSPFKLAEDEPVVQVAVIRPVQVGESTSSSRPPASGQRSSTKPVAALASSEPSDLLATPSAAPAGRTVQLSLGTIVFGILTTVLAVIVVMLVMQRSSNKPDAAPAASGRTATPAAQPAELPQAQAPRGAAVVDPAGTGASAADVADMAQSSTGKVDHHKHGPLAPGKSSGKPGPGETDNRNNSDSKQPEQPSKGHFIPNEL
jgi:hypothetical protein